MDVVVVGDGGGGVGHGKGKIVIMRIIMVDVVISSASCRNLIYK